MVYSLNEIASEKSMALLDPARTEPRDLYDLWYLTCETNSVDLVDCFLAIDEKLLHRNKKLNAVRDEFHMKEARLKKTWGARLSTQMTNLPEFNSVYRAVKRIFRRSKISG